MKGGWLAAAVLSAMVLVSVGHIRVVSCLSEKMTDSIREAESLVKSGDWTGAQKLTHEAEIAWKSKERYIRITQTHGKADEISLDLAQLAGALETRKTPEYLASSRQLLTRLQLLEEGERPTIQNLL